MKKFLFGALAVIMFAACEHSKVKTIDITVTVSEANLEAGIATPEAYTVTLTNLGSSQVSEAETVNGIADFKGILPGMYNVVVAGKAAANGIAYTFAGNLNNVSILDASDVAVAVSAVKQNALIFKEIYYTGCSKVDPETNKKTTYFKDQFYEIYNNSDQTVYADGLCITTLHAVTATADYEYHIDNAEKYVFAKDPVWQLPGSGKDYPIAPGESIIIALWGTNHQVSDLAPYSPVNLSGVEFEAINETLVAAGLTDNAAINMNLVADLTPSVKKQWLTSVFGCYYVIFFPEEPVSPEKAISATYMTANVSVIPIPLTSIVDGVEAIKNEASISNKKIFNPDAGYIYCSSNYVGESIVRKIDHTEADGRVVYQDTNNSTNDFEVSTTPTPRRNGAKVPSWNTWNK